VPGPECWRMPTRSPWRFRFHCRGGEATKRWQIPEVGRLERTRRSCRWSGLRMDMSVITAASALAGAAIGGFTSLIAAWLSHRVQARAERLAHYQLRRQELYKEFIEKASELYIHALQNDKPDLSGLMRLYAEISRMRILSSSTVVNSADQIVKNIIRVYLEPNKTFPELRDMADSGSIDPLRNFSEACRAEAESLHYEPPD
jgi:hypothetical protein